jgi:hypothetical protein
MSADQVAIDRYSTSFHHPSAAASSQAIRPESPFADRMLGQCARERTAVIGQEG